MDEATQISYEFGKMIGPIIIPIIVGIIVGRNLWKKRHEKKKKLKMAKLICKICRCIVVEDISNIDSKQQYVTCPVCGRIFENPVYKIKFEEK